MKIRKSLAIDQNSPEMVELAGKMNINPGMCGFITCAITHFLASQPTFNPQDITSINPTQLTPHIISAIRFIMARRRFELKKFYKIMSDPQRKLYLSEPVANFEVADYLDSHQSSFLNKQVFFFRHCAYDQPGKVEAAQYEEHNRIEEEYKYRNELFFYSSFEPYTNHFKAQFCEVLRNVDPTKPVIIATDILGHFYTTVLFQGRIYILDSLTSYMQTENDSAIVECIKRLYIESFMKKLREGYARQYEARHMLKEVSKSKSLPKSQEKEKKKDT